MPFAAWFFCLLLLTTVVPIPPSSPPHPIKRRTKERKKESKKNKATKQMKPTSQRWCSTQSVFRLQLLKGQELCCWFIVHLLYLRRRFRYQLHRLHNPQVYPKNYIGNRKGKATVTNVYRVEHSRVPGTQHIMLLLRMYSASPPTG